ncbi:hypothetical protein SASPL_104711 [Salvia splendens]|uniref:Uncharacterized protein n=1 Tax=Salvia splendens TaxID=180675 RepID=A0A8X8YKE6_SALSN|nr:hypothetical protein SASPL_104711 [Salvia splendens]
MEQIGGATPFRRHHKPAERFLGVLQPQSPSSAPPIELSEHDIFSTPSGYSSPPPPTHQNLYAASPSSHYGILSALNGTIKIRSESEHDVQPRVEGDDLIKPSIKRVEGDGLINQTDGLINQALLHEKSEDMHVRNSLESRTREKTSDSSQQAVIARANTSRACGCTHAHS